MKHKKKQKSSLENEKSRDREKGKKQDEMSTINMIK